VLAAGLANAAGSKNVLVYSGSTGYRHQSIPTGIEALKAVAAREGFAVDTSEDPNVFASERLKQYAVIVFLSSTTEPKNAATEWLTGKRRGALQEFVRAGKGIVAIHAAADSHYHWPWYVQMIGGSFERHPRGTPAGVLTVTDPAHPATRQLSETIPHTDEWYYYKDFDPRVRVLLTVDPASIGESDVNPNPIAWAHEFDGGRVFYTGLGHTAETYNAEFFQKHIAGALRWAAGDAQ
jgi:type 1 glutamine amidotransferase